MRDPDGPSGPPDVDLLRSVASGDTGALSLLYDRHAPWLSVRLRRRCRDQELVADALQDTFVAAWQAASRFRGDGDVGAWLWGIAIRRLISRIRSSSRSVASPVEVADHSSSPAAEELVLMGLEYGDLGSALASLSPEFRSVIQATVLDGLTVKETAELLGIPTGTVKSRAKRARVQLRRNLVGGVS